MFSHQRIARRHGATVELLCLRWPADVAEDLPQAHLVPDARETYFGILRCECLDQVLDTAGDWVLVARDGKKLGYVERTALAKLQ